MKFNSTRRFLRSIVLSLLTCFLTFLILCALSCKNADAAEKSPGLKPAQVHLNAAPLSLKSYLTKPKLVVVLVIDQFRADYLTRFASRFLPSKGASSPGGFNYLMTKGAYFPFAEYDVLQSMTCPGHATILTGAFPYTTHIPLNEFWDAARAKLVPCTEDEASPTVGIQQTKTEEAWGDSPVRLNTDTVGDELKNAGFPSRVIAIALKARAAVMLGGHRADLATWFHPDQLKWVSSKYYLPDDQLPIWLADLNKEVTRSAQTKYVWSTAGSPTGFSAKSKKEAGFPRTIDYRDKDALASPLGNELTTTAALAAVKAYHLGSGHSPDLLAISYSSHDLLGHEDGPNSAEMEEMTVAEDASLAKLFTGLQKAVPGGLSQVEIVLTADHGMAPAADYSKQAKLGSVEIDEPQLVKTFNAVLEKKFGRPEEGVWIRAVQSMNFYLNRDDKRAELGKVQSELRDLVAASAGFETAVSAADVQSGRLPPGLHARQIKNTYVPGLSGDVIGIPHPFSYNGHHPTHVTGYTYDRSVPLIVAGPHIRAGVYSTSAQVVDIAPTLSFLLGILPPATSEGRVLSEAIGN